MMTQRELVNASIDTVCTTPRASRGMTTVGTFTGGEWYLYTAHGPQRVSSIRVLSDGPWAVCGSGLDERSFAVCTGDRLYSTPAAALRAK